MRRNGSILVIVGLLVAAAGAFVLWSRRDAGSPAPIDAPIEAPAADRPPSGPDLATAPVRLEPEARAAAKPPVSAADEALRVTIVERVLAPDGSPIGGASVEVRIGAEVRARATSDAAGAVSVDVDPTDAEVAGAVVFTRASGGLVAARPVTWLSGPPAGPRRRERTIDLGDVTLEGGASVEFRVRDAAGAGAVAEVSVSWPWYPTQPIGAATSSADGRATIEGIPPGSLCARARGATGRGIAWFSAPRKVAGPVEITLAALRDVEVVVVEKESRAPVPGARVEVLEAVTIEGGTSTLPYAPAPDVPPTDAQGRTKIVGVAGGASISLAATAPGFPAPPRGGFRGWRATPVPADATSVEIALDRGRTVSWAVTSGEVPPPPDGTALALEQQTGSGTAEPTGTARMEGGKIVVDGVLPEPTHWLAVAPDGSQASLFSLPGQTEGKATSFVRTRQVDVRLRWSDGAPASGLFVSLRDQGNNPIGSVAKTDADGAATIARLEPRQVDVYVGWMNTPWAGRRVATADLRQASARVETILPRRREGTISVLLDGVPGLPEAITPGFGAAEYLQIVARDAKAGTLRVSMWPAATDAGMTLPFDAPGWTTEGAVTAPGGSGAFEARLVLRRAGGVDIEVVGARPAQVVLRLDRLDPPAAEAYVLTFSSSSWGSGQARIDSEGHWRLPTVPPGRYRVRDSRSSAVSPDFDVVAGTTTSSRIDCANVGVIEGRVLVPDGVTTEGITVSVAPAPPPDPLGQDGRALVRADGTFSLKVPGDREVEVTAADPLLVPDASGGVVRARAGAKDVTIRLVRGPSCRLTFDRAPAASPFPGRRNPVKVYLWRGAMRGAPTARVDAVIDGKALRFSHYEPGTYGLMIDLPDAAPVVRTDVALGDGATALGPVTLSAGSTIGFDVVVPPGQSAPRLYAAASSVDAPASYLRQSPDANGGRITGLGRGRFRVKVHVITGMMGGGVAAFDREVEVDGVTDLTLKVEIK